MIAKYDHAGQFETHGGAATSSLYGGRDKDFAEAVQEAVGKDPPGGQAGGFGGFKVIQSDVHQLVYGADPSGVCKSRVIHFVIPSWWHMTVDENLKISISYLLFLLE